MVIASCISTARKYSKSSEENYKITAFLVRNGKPFSIATNLGWKHAEARCIDQASSEKIKNSIMYVIRITKEGLGIAKPCKKCQGLIKDTTIKKVYYTTNDNTLETWEFHETD
ncbi:hypothetical protein HYS94_01615 [Candidatus Daviesbacteria bacterium]|nr:hypothetical protein [Candidatus Daviesbacteria bacterium]